MTGRPRRTVIHVGGGAPVFSAEARFFDGRTATEHAAHLTMREAGPPALEIQVPGQPPVHWPHADIRTVPDQAKPGEMVLALKNDPVARLVLDDPTAQAILRARCPNLRKRPRPRGLARLAAWAVAAVAAVALIILVLVPVMADQLADYLPPEGEKALGDATFEQIRAALDESGVDPIGICDGPAGTAALGAMAARLTRGAELPYEIEVTVLDHDLINAFALPGGRIVLFDGLLQAAGDPDEIAAVFAHEIGHVAARDPTRGALRTAGSIGVLGLLFGDFAGGTVVLFLAEQLIAATYSREAEAAADAFAVNLLTEARLPPDALARMFERFRREFGDGNELLAAFASHPRLADRIDTIAEAAGKREDLEPSLTPAAWTSLKQICR